VPIVIGARYPTSAAVDLRIEQLLTAAHEKRLQARSALPGALAMDSDPMPPIVFRRNLAWGSAYAAHSETGATASNAGCMHADYFAGSKGTNGLNLLRLAIRSVRAFPRKTTSD
jgi:hypothetical protein